ncbi:MAG: hypothetical protein ACK4SA_07195 [Caldilinea sp.]
MSKQSSTMVRVHDCPWPAFDTTIDPCDREIYDWIERVPAVLRTVSMNIEWQRIAFVTSQRQQEIWSRCEASRYSAPSVPTSGLRIAIASQVAGLTERSTANDTAAHVSARLSLTFTPSTTTPNTCPPIAYPVLHRVAHVGINSYLHNTQIDYTSPASTSYDGIGPWEGSKVFIAWTRTDWSLRNLQHFFRSQVKLRNPKVFDHWVQFAPFDTPPPPESVIARGQPFDPNALKVLTIGPASGQGWRVITEYSNQDTGATLLVDRWLTGGLWSEVGLGGYGTEYGFFDTIPANAPTDTDGTWLHRVCVYAFQRPPTAISVRYDGIELVAGHSAITPSVTTEYQPGISTGIARADESVQIRTVGANKAAFRILGIEPVPGFGVRFTVQLINELHFEACIVTPFLSGIGDRSSWQTNAGMHYEMPAVWVVRNLPANSASEPIGVLVPMRVLQTGDWPLRDLHWRLAITQQAYPAPPNQFPDGVYGSGSSALYPDIGGWAPPGYRISSNPEQVALLLAGYLENGDVVWNSAWDSSADTQRVLLTMPVRRAPGAEVLVQDDPQFPNSGPNYFQQKPFRAYIEWTAEKRISSNPEVWEPRSGRVALGLELPQALARYGRTLTLSVAAGRPMWSLYYGKWITVFEAWPGGDVEELEVHLVDTYLRPNYPTSQGWRKFQYTSLKKPYLTANVAWWHASTPIQDRPGYLHALTLIKEASSADTVDVALIGYW